MRKTRSIFFFFLPCIIFYKCSKNPSGSSNNPPPLPSNFNVSSWSVNGNVSQSTNSGVNQTPVIILNFPTKIDRSSVSNSISFKENSGTSVNYSASYSNADSAVIISPSQSLKGLTKYNLSVSTQLKSSNGGNLSNSFNINLITGIDSTDKLPTITDDSLLTLVQKQTFNYFWDFAHPVSGLARERNSSGDIVTTGGSGFGIMAIITAIHRNFITRTEGLTRLQTIVTFLKTKAQTFHGAYPHWLNGETGIVVPFSAKDDGADLVETSYLMQGLLCARQFFDGGDVAETSLRNDINSIWNNIEWDWFRKNNEDVLYWHWSPNYNWDMNVPIRGWNECLITYVLAASSPGHSIPKSVYDNGWAQNGAMRNGNTYYGYTLPLGPAFGGPLFFAHYSFLGINPNNLTDSYADYQTQVDNHTKINYEYCKANPNKYYGYSAQCWGLTASDIPNGYTASSPTNDIGVIAPTAALSSFPYTPTESMQALKFFYYKLGDKLWGQYGFHDAFSLKDLWFADSYLAIDQGPIIVMLENYRSSLLWNLFMSCPEVKTGMHALGFQSPNL
jgi:hypothetical protein